MTARIRHNRGTSGTANPAVEVDLAAWEEDHTLSGTFDGAQMPALTGDVTTTAGSTATTLGKTHLVTYTVAPSGASTADKMRADFVGDGTNDQVAVNAAVTAARAISSYSKVVMLPGRYTFSNTANLGGAAGENGFVFEARGTFINGPGVSGVATALDTFMIQNSNFSEFNFGSILTNNTGTAAAIHSQGNYSETKITWQSLQGTSRGGYGYFADTTSAATSQSVNWLTGTHVQGFAKGIVLQATGASANIDTYRSTIDYIYDNNVGIYVHGSTGGSGHINACVWNVNIDAHKKNGDIGFQTNSWYDVINATIGPVVTEDAGTCTNIQLDSGATSVILNLTPQNLAVTAGSIVNNSGNTNHLVNIGMPITLLAGTDARGSIPVWDGGNRGQLQYSGLSFGSGIGTTQKHLYFSSAGVIGESKVAITEPATGAVLTIDNNKTFRASNTITLAGTDGTTLTGPTTNAALARTDAAQTFTGVQTFSSTISGSINGNAATVTTNANLTGDVTSSGNATTLTNAPVIAKVLTGYVSGSGTVSATDSILAAIQKLNGNDALKATAANPTFTGTVTASGPFGAWSTYVPTFAASNAGTAPTVTTQSARYWTIGKTTFVAVKFTITSVNGNTGQNVVMLLPNTAAGEVALPFFESGVSGNIGVAIPAAATTVTLNFYSNALTPTNTINYVHHVCGSYENT